MSVIGFDLGYQSCYVAVARAGGIETIANEYSDRNTPTYIAFGERQRAFGASAKQQHGGNIKNTVIGVKRLLGRQYTDPMVQNEKQFAFYDMIANDDGRVAIQVQHLNETTVLDPPQACAVLLSKLKQTAETALKNKVTDCVISVPSYFTDVERRSLLGVSKIVGLNCLRLMNETTAVALSYGIYKQDHPAPDEKPRIVVFIDMGHSSLQVSACAFNKGKLKMLATTSDPYLGGRDFDHVIFEYICTDFLQNYKIDVKTKPKAMVRLYQECEKLKKLMSANTNVLPLSIECFMEDKDVRSSMKRAHFEQLAAPLFDRVEKVFKELLTNAGLKCEDIESVEIVGGSTRIPYMKTLVQTVFDKTASTTLNADEAVARGCALQCAILSPTFRVRDFTIVDCQPYHITLSWKSVLDDSFSDLEVFAQYHPIPFTKMLTFFRKEDFTLTGRYVGDIPSSDNVIGDFIIKQVKSTPDNESSKVKVKVRVDVHGIFNVASASLVEKTSNDEEVEESIVFSDDTPLNDVTDSGVDISSAVKNSNVKEGKPAENQDTKDKKKSNKVKLIDLPIEAKVADISDKAILIYTEKENYMACQDKMEKERSDAKNAVEEYVYYMRDMISDKLREYITDEDREKFSTSLIDTEDWLYDEGEDVSKELYCDRLNHLKKLGAPVQKRAEEAQSRPAALDALGKSIMLVHKALDSYEKQEQLYNHISRDDISKIQKQLNEKRDWLNGQQNAQNQRKAYEDPIITASEIIERKKDFEKKCWGILNQSKPEVNNTEEMQKTNSEEASGNPDEERMYTEQTTNTTVSGTQETDMDID